MALYSGEIVPLYIDVHDIQDVSAEAVAEAHHADLATQQKHGVNYIKYWLNEDKRKVFCLCTAPNAEAAEHVHREAHGMIAERIIEVDPDLADGLLGQGTTSDSGAALTPRSGRYDPGIRTIVFTDIVGSTALTQRLGDGVAMQLVELHDRLVRNAIDRHAGRVVKHLGDGIMAVFVSAHDAVQCASEIQTSFRDQVLDSGEPIRVRIGAAAGEPVERQGDFFGSTVQLAARLCAKADPGQTLVSTSVTELCGALRFVDAGALELKGFEQPTRAHAVAE
ncbi:MAG TPA: nickel-binding protein [Polyangiaceae bacterium]|nr:nickel-binding protein [Polyangiaceae bacterium]